jgi:hypothetical protein
LRTLQRAPHVCLEMHEQEHIVGSPALATGDLYREEVRARQQREVSSNEFCPGRRYALWRRRYAVAAQNITDRLIGDRASRQSGHSPGIDFPWPSAQSIPRLLCRLAVGPSVGVLIRAHLRGLPVAAADTRGIRWPVRAIAASRQALPCDEAAAPWPVLLALGALGKGPPRDRHRDDLLTEMTYPMTEPAEFLSVLHHPADERLKTLR